MIVLFGGCGFWRMFVLWEFRFCLEKEFEKFCLVDDLFCEKRMLIFLIDLWSEYDF